MDRLRALEVFVAVADGGSLAAAARAMSISAPSVTRVLGELEAELGVLLFHRTTRALTLTDDGQHFLFDARDVLARYKSATDSVRGAHLEPQGMLRLTAPNLFGQHYVVPLLLEFLDRYPAAQVEAVFADHVVNLVEERFDLAVRMGELEDSNLVATRVGSVRSVICGSPAYFEQYGVPESPEDLAQHRLISAGWQRGKVTWPFKDGGHAVDARLVLSSLPAAISAVKQGWGLTRVLSYQIAPDLGGGGVETVLQDFEPEPMPIHIVHAEGRLASAKVRAFVAMARDAFRANPFINPP